MTDKEYAGIITNVEPTSARVKVQLDTVPGKTLVWAMTNFIDKPRPGVGKLLTCTARPGPHDELKAWRELRAELPPGKEPTSEESAPTLVVDQTHIWKCPECGVKFQHLHSPDGKHKLREVD